jgi:hypothetical protein
MPCRWQLLGKAEDQTLELVITGAPGGERVLSFYFDEEDGGITL